MVAIENFDGKLVKNASWQILKFHNSLPAYHMPFKG